MGDLADSFERNVYCVLGLPFDAVDMAGTVAAVRDAAGRRQKFLLSTANVNFVVASRSDGEFRDSVIRSDLCVADGMPVVWIARMLGVPLPERVAGSSMLETLRNSDGPRMSVYFFGGPPGVGEAACRALRREDRGLECAGFQSPGYGSVEDLSGADCIRSINASHADLLVVSIGARKGQAWIQHNWRRLEVPVTSYLGATINFVAGAARRAPAWLQRWGLEWVWRIKEDRTLLGRYVRDGFALAFLVLTRALPYVIYRVLRAPAGSLPPLSTVQVGEENGALVVRLSGQWTRKNVAQLRSAFAEAVRSGKDTTLDLAHVAHVDSAFVGRLILLQDRLKQRGARLRVWPIPKPLRRVIYYCCAEYLCADGAP